jgi:antitoxin (DNA-binding transcriptional repressor) of toxin-antitoxin stability system
MISIETATRHNREPSKVLRQVESGKTVMIEKFGEQVAAIIPWPHKTTGKDLARRLEGLRPAPEAADELEAIIEGMNHAGRRSY